MNNLENHLINLVISILGSAITMIIAYFWKFRRLFEKHNFRNQQSAEESILKDIEQSKTLRVYAMCGSTFSDSVNSNIAKKVLTDTNLEQLYLISGDKNTFIHDRQKELPKNSSDLKTKIKNSINEFNTAKNNNQKIDYRLHDKKVGFRLIILDNCLYLSQQENGKYGKETEIQKINKGTPAYNNYLAYFNDLWEKYSSKT